MAREISDMEATKRRNQLLNKERLKKKKDYDKLDDIEKQKLKVSVMVSRIKTVEGDLLKFNGIAIENKLKVMKEVLEDEENVLKEMSIDNSTYACIGCKFESKNIKDFNKVKNDPYHYCNECLKKYNLEAIE